MSFVYIMLGINIVFTILLIIVMSGIKTETDVYNGVVKDKMQLLISKLYQLENDNRHIYEMVRSIEDTTDIIDSKMDDMKKANTWTYQPMTVTYDPNVMPCMNEVKDI